MRGSDLVAAEDAVYWISKQKELVALSAGASTPRVVTACEGATGPFVLNDNRLFWAKQMGERSLTTDNDAIWMRPLTGGPPHAFTGRLDPIIGMHAAGNKLYFIEEHHSTVMVGLMD
jgi:hypothetical protein